MTNLRRRLRRLEASIMPSTVRKVWRIITVNSDGTREPTEHMIEWPSKKAMEHSQGKLTKVFQTN